MCCAEWFFSMLKSFFFSCSEELKKFFFSRAEHFFSSSTSSFRFVHEHTDGALYTTTIIWSSSSSFFPLYFFLFSTLYSTVCSCTHIHAHTRARAHTNSVTHACILHSYEPSRAFIRSSCMCACVSVCTTCLRETSVQCSIRNHMFFSFIAVRRKMPPDGILNVKCAIRHWAYTRTSVHVCMCVCVSVSFRTCMHVCIVQSMPEEFGGTFWTGDFVIFNFFEMAAENVCHFPALQQWKMHFFGIAGHCRHKSTCISWNLSNFDFIRPLNLTAYIAIRFELSTHSEREIRHSAHVRKNIVSTRATEPSAAQQQQ